MDKVFKWYLILGMLISFSSSFAQERNAAKDLEGIWVGKLYNDTTREFLDYELAISDFNQKLSGFSRTIFTIDSIKNVGIKKVKISEKGGKILIEDEKLIDNNYTEPPAKGVRTYFTLSFSENDSTYLLNGTWRTNGTRQYTPLTGFINLSKRKPVDTIAIIKRLKELGLQNDLSFLPSVRQSKSSVELSRENLKTPSPEVVAAPTVDERNHAKESAELNSKKTDTPVVEKILVKNMQPEEKKVSKNLVKNNAKQLDDQQAAMVAQALQKNKIIPDTTILNPEIVITSPHKSIKIKDEKGAPKNDVAQISVQQKVEVEKAKEGIVKEMDKKPLVVDTQEALVKEKKIIAIPEPSHLKEPQLNTLNNVSVTAPSKNLMPDLSLRKIETIQSVNITSDSLILTLYDNGAVDGDTVSVIMNGVVIMPRVGLSEKAFNKTIHLTPDLGDSINIIMYAENLGSIPPNTGLLVVRDGDKNYEIRFSGDLTKNSAIILRRKKL